MYLDDASFIGELTRARNKGADAFLFTAYSAIPLADAIRGFYLYIGEELPVIDYVMARKVHKGEHHKAKLLSEEVPRLTGVLADCRRVCVVEQYVSTLNTLFFAHQIVAETTQAGIAQDDIRGKYYHLVDPSDVDLEAVTSIHQEFMKEIGRKVAATMTHDRPNTRQ